MRFYRLDKLVRLPVANDETDAYGDCPVSKLQPVAWYFAESIDAAKAIARKVHGAKFSGRFSPWLVRECAQFPNGDWSQDPAPRNAAAELGSKGGSAKSEAKSKAARENGAKGGRPRLAK